MVRNVLQKHYICTDFIKPTPLGADFFSVNVILL